MVPGSFDVIKEGFITTKQISSIIHEDYDIKIFKSIYNILVSYIDYIKEYA